MARFVAAFALSAMLIAAGAAAGARIRGTGAGELLRGTSGPDTILAGGGDDRVLAGRGDDFVRGGRGRDTVIAGPGDDRVSLQADDAADRVVCGQGRDLVNLERGDFAAPDCEVVARRLFRGLPSVGGQLGTEVEPDSMSHGRSVVAAFQLGRFFDGGAGAIGFAVSRDAGRSWQSGILPALTTASRPPGSFDRVSDPVVAHDARHGMWLVASLAASERGDAMLISRSRDGRRWSAPTTVVRGEVESLDKEWIVCDNWAMSRYRGSCYLAYLALPGGELELRTSRDAGATWSPAVSAVRPPAGLDLNGVQPVVRPDGTVVLVYTAFANGFGVQLQAARSRDGGATFEPPVRVARVADISVWGVRAPPLPSADVDAAGRIYVAWHDCDRNAGCLATGIALARSSDGVSWSAPTRVPAAPGAPLVNHFVPGLVVAPATAGARARVAITYHSAPQCGPSCAGVTVSVIESRTGGSSWRRPERLTAESMPLDWIADTNIGRMLGDYVSTSVAGGRVLPVFSLASPPVQRGFRQAIFAARLP